MEQSIRFSANLSRRLRLLEPMMVVRQLKPTLPLVCLLPLLFGPSCATLKIKSVHHALRVYAGQGNIELVKEALKNGANINSQNQTEREYLDPKGKRRLYEGDTALIAAVRQGHMDVAKLLIEAKADLNIRNSYAYTALMVATRNRSKEFVRLLLDSGADVNIYDAPPSFTTALSIARRINEHELVNLLIEAGAGIKGQANDSAVLRTLPSAKADKAICERWTRMCETGPCGEEVFSTLTASDVIWIKGRSDKKDRVGKWNNYWYNISLDNGTCKEEIWVYGEFLTIEH